jgi:hypothetical protein
MMSADSQKPHLGCFCFGFGLLICLCSLHIYYLHLVSTSSQMFLYYFCYCFGDTAHQKYFSLDGFKELPYFINIVVSLPFHFHQNTRIC